MIYYKGVALIVIIITFFFVLCDLYKLHKYWKTTEDGSMKKFLNYIMTIIFVAFDLYIGKCIVDYLEYLAHSTF